MTDSTAYEPGVRSARFRPTIVSSWLIGLLITFRSVFNGEHLRNIPRDLPVQRTSRASIWRTENPCGSIKAGEIVLLGDVIARFHDEALVSETLLSLGDLALIARINARAEQCQMSTGEFAADLIGQFINGASDEEWLTLVGQLSHADNPDRVFLHRALSNATPA